MGINVEYDVTVRQIVSKTEDGKEPVVEIKNFASATAGAEEAAALLEALAVRVRGAKKVMGWGILLDAIKKATEQENQKRQAAGKPTLIEELRETMNGSTGATKPRR